MVPALELSDPVPALRAHVTVSSLSALPLLSMAVTVTTEVLTPSRRMLVSEAEMLRSLIFIVIVAVLELPTVAVTVAEPLRELVNVEVALPSLSVVAGEVTVPSVVEKLTDLPTTGLPEVVSDTDRVIVAVSVPSAMIEDWSDEILRLTPRREIDVLAELPLTTARIVALLSESSAASAV